jgi:ABC-type lipoprotein export system ATPase subunit
MVTHDQKAADYASRILHVDKGQLVEAAEQRAATVA